MKAESSKNEIMNIQNYGKKRNVRITSWGIGQLEPPLGTGLGQRAAIPNTKNHAQTHSRDFGRSDPSDDL